MSQFRKEKAMSETILNKTPAKSADLGEETLKAMEARCEAATPGPWRTEDCYSGVTTNVVCADRRTHGYGCGNDFICDLNDGDYHEYMSIGEQKANAEFIANAREDLPRLLTAYRAVKAENERLEDEPPAYRFYYCESEDSYLLGRRLGNFYYAHWHDGMRFVWDMSRYLPWGEHVVSPGTAWKEHTYPSEPIEISPEEWFKGFIERHSLPAPPKKEEV
jgi:hypothetical protein